jgi:hypothetical protein
MWNITLHLKRTGKAGVVNQETIDQVKKFIQANVLDTVHFDTTKGIAVVRATKSGLEQAFSAKDGRGRVAANGIRMVVVVVGGVRYRNIEGQLALPPGVTKVTGFDTRPVAQPEAKKAAPEGNALA